MFSPPELELLISGLPDIDIDELRIHTEYVQYRSTDNLIQWFWEILHSFSGEEKAMFLQFVTGTSKVPLEGFENLQGNFFIVNITRPVVIMHLLFLVTGMRGTQKFNIHRAYGDTQALPSAHTCFNQVLWLCLCILAYDLQLTCLIAQLDLPEYGSKDELRDKLLMAVKEGSEGFGFG